MHVYLRLVNGEQIEQTVDSNICVIGRSAKCDVVVPHDGMSRQHCQVELENGEVFITDLGSTNGVLIDGEKIVPHTKTPYALYLSCSFGAVQNMQIELEEMKGGTLNNRSSGLRDSSLSSSSGATSLTKTKILKENTRPADMRVHGRPVPPAKVKDNKFQMWTMNILALLILGAAVYWYMTKDEEPVESAIQIEKDVPDKPFDQF